MKYILTKGSGIYFSRMDRNPKNDILEVVETTSLKESKKYDLKNANEMREWILETTGERWEIEEYNDPGFSFS